MGRAERGERRNVRVLKANYIQEFSVVGKYDDPLDPAGCVLDLAAIHAREEAALRSVLLTASRAFWVLLLSTVVVIIASYASDFIFILFGFEMRS